jgi:SAM-dependent methyltransferase
MGHGQHHEVHPTEVLLSTSPTSAAVVAPLLEELVHPTSVLDVGCGIGAWIEAFDPGIATLGIDELDPSNVAGHYQQVDLAQPFDVGRFDLALCLEVGEHLQPTEAPTLVASLVRAAPVVAFSAAIPGQYGFGHVNLQWPDYWAELFEAHGYRQFDAIRARIWDDDRVAWWYRQNLFLYAAEQEFESRPPTHFVHPALLEQRSTPLSSHSVMPLLRALPTSINRAVRVRVDRLRRHR